MRNLQKVFTNQAAIGTSSVVERQQLTRAFTAHQPIMAKFTVTGLSHATAAGVSIKLESYNHAKEAYVDACALKTVTDPSVAAFYLHGNVLTKGVRYRLEITAISNGVTVTAAWIGIGSVEN